MTLQAQIDKQQIGQVRWYGKRESRDFAVPTFGKHGLEVDGQLIDPVGGLPLVSPYQATPTSELRTGALEHPEIIRSFPIMDEQIEQASWDADEVIDTADQERPEVPRA
jgi:NADH-quinone oxidoreductase subunit B